MNLTVLIPLALVGYLVAYLVADSELFGVALNPLRTRLARAADNALSAMDGASTKAGYAVAWLRWTGLYLVGELLTCRRCLGIEAVLLWSWWTGWPGWTASLAAAGLSLALAEWKR